MMDYTKSGTYSELLPCGGKLIVARDKWTIEYYFAGIDRRHNGEFISVPGSQIDAYIHAWTSNWAEFQSLLQSVPQGGEFTKSGALHMTIRVSKWRQGVCLRGFNRCVSNEQELYKVVSSYEYAKTRAEQIAKVLAAL